MFSTNCRFSFARLRDTSEVRRRAFTLVELLVVIAIIGILISLLLPAVQQAREAGRRLTCTSNIRQLAIAVQSYNNTHGLLPASGIVAPMTRQWYTENDVLNYPVFNQRSGKMFSWAVLLLPYMEEQNLYDQFDKSVSVLEQPREPQRTSLPALLCPSDGAQNRLYMDEDFSGGKWFAKGNYAAYDSPMHGDLQMLYPGALIATGQKLSKVTSGASKTIVFSEVRTRDSLQDERGVWALPWNGASLLAYDMHPKNYYWDVNAPDFDPSDNPLILEQVQSPNTLGPNADILMRCPEEDLAANELEGMPCHRWVWNLGLAGYISAAPRSNHVGGVNGAFLDGHVAFISDNIDPLVFDHYIDIRDSQVITDGGN